MLYVSSQPSTAVFESKLALGQHFAIIEYIVRDRCSLNLENVGFHGINKNGFKGVPPTVTELYSLENLQKLGLNKYGARNVREVHRRLGEIFMRDDAPRKESEYAITVAITEFLLTLESADGMMSPSTRSMNDFNTAINPASADKKLIPTKVLGFRVVDGTGDRFAYEQIAYSTSIGEEGRIEWANGNPTPAFDWSLD